MNKHAPLTEVMGVPGEEKDTWGSLKGSRGRAGVTALVFPSVNLRDGMSAQGGVNRGTEFGWIK